MSISPELPLVEYQFNFQVLNNLWLPDFSGSLWHSVFGSALHDGVCIGRDLKCDTCILLHSCDYSYLYSTPRPLNTEIMRKYKTIPAPHIIRPEQTKAQSFVAGQTVSLRFILIGNANQKLPLVIWSLLTAGSIGLGKSRSKLALQDVWQLQANNLPRLIYQQNEIKTQPDNKPLAIIAMPSQVMLRFITPYRQDNNNFKAGTMDIKKFLMAIVRRVSLLQYFYTGKALDADYKQLKVLIDELPIISQLENKCHQRYSAKPDKLLDASGVMGQLELNLTGMDDLWTYLYLGQWLNVGKNASMGFGHYQLSS
jgi:hypothetical protein